MDSIFVPEIPWFYFVIGVMLISSVLYGLPHPKPTLSNSLSVYPGSISLSYLCIHLDIPLVFIILLFIIFSLLVPAYLLYRLTLRHPEEEDKVLQNNGWGFWMYFLSVIFIMTVGIYYLLTDMSLVERRYVFFFIGAILSMIGSIPLLLSNDLAEIEASTAGFKRGTGSSISLSDMGDGFSSDFTNEESNEEE